MTGHAIYKAVRIPTLSIMNTHFTPNDTVATVTKLKDSRAWWPALAIDWLKKRLKRPTIIGILIFYNVVQASALAMSRTRVERADYFR